MSPSLQCDSPLDKKIKKEMITGMFNLIGVCLEKPQKESFKEEIVSKELAILKEVMSEMKRAESTGFNLIYPSR